MNKDTKKLVNISNYFLIESDFRNMSKHSDYRIVIPFEPHGYEEYAAKELLFYIAEATGITLDIISEEKIEYSKASKLLIVGETAISEKVGVVIDKNITGGRGFIIKTVDSNVFLIGGNSEGTLNSVYEFLRYEFGFEAYNSEEIALEHNVTQKRVFDFDIVDVPDIPYVEGEGIYLRESSILDGHKLSYEGWNDVFINTGSTPWHNTFDVIPPEIYYKSHPKWFIGTDEIYGQLHYTCYGDEKEYRALQDEVLKRFIYFIERNFEKGNFCELIGFMFQDSKNWAESDEPYRKEGAEDSVQKFKDKYGNAYPVAMLIKFINPVARRLKEYMDKKWSGRKMYIVIFAYLACENAPVKLENGKYVPIDEEVILEPNVNVQVAPIYADYCIDVRQTYIPELVEKWSALTKSFSFWFYDYYFGHTFFYFNSTYRLQKLYKFAIEHGALWVGNEGSTVEHCAPFEKLRIYLTSKLTWNIDCDVDALIDNYFNNFYKKASVNMRKFFDEVVSYMNIAKTTRHLIGIGGFGVGLSIYWDEKAVKKFKKYADAAFKDIECYKESDTVLYKKLYDRILRESLMPRFMQLEFFSNTSFASDECFQKEVDCFLRDCAHLNITHFSINNKLLRDYNFVR